MNEEELRTALARERVVNADLQDIIRDHWNTVVDLRRRYEFLQPTIDRVMALADKWQTDADYARKNGLYDEYAELEDYAQQLRNAISPPNKE